MGIDIQRGTRGNGEVPGDGQRRSRLIGIAWRDAGGPVEKFEPKKPKG